MFNSTLWRLKQKTNKKKQPQNKRAGRKTIKNKTEKKKKQRRRKEKSDKKGGRSGKLTRVKDQSEHLKTQKEEREGRLVSWFPVLDLSSLSNNPEEQQ